MTTDSIINQIRLQSPKGLAKVYQGVCEEYRKRLCDQWEIPFEESWWQGDLIGSGLFIPDCWLSLSIQELRYFVDNCVPKKDYLEYLDYVGSEIRKSRDCKWINIRSWFELGARPKDLK